MLDAFNVPGCQLARRPSSRYVFSLRAATLGIRVTLARWCSLREILAHVLCKASEDGVREFWVLQSRAARLPSGTSIFDSPMSASGLIWKNGCESSRLKTNKASIVANRSGPSLSNTQILKRIIATGSKPPSMGAASKLAGAESFPPIREPAVKLCTLFLFFSLLCLSFEAI